MQEEPLFADEPMLGCHLPEPWPQVLLACAAIICLALYDALFRCGGR